MTTLEINRITWENIKERALEDETEIEEYILESEYHYLYEPISWEILDKLLTDKTRPQYNMIIALIDDEQFQQLHETMSANSWYQRNLVNEWLLNNYDNPED